MCRYCFVGPNLVLVMTAHLDMRVRLVDLLDLQHEMCRLVAKNRTAPPADLHWYLLYLAHRLWYRSRGLDVSGV